MMIKIMKSVCLVLTCILLCTGVVFVGRSFSQGSGDFRDLKFASTNAALKFFDPNSGELYVYSTETGNLINIWILEELGEDLKRYHPKRKYYREN